MDSESAIDPALCFENEIRKAQINKESLIAVFFFMLRRHME